MATPQAETTVAPAPAAPAAEDGSAGEQQAAQMKEPVDANGACEDADADAEEEGTEAGQAGASATDKKKKKKRRKKKRGGAGAKTGDGIFAMSDADFAAMCEGWLEATKAQDDEVPEAEQHTPASKFNGYTFSGALRNEEVSRQMQVPEGVVKPDYGDDGFPASEQDAKTLGAPIHAHTPEEVAQLREVCRIGRDVLDIGGRFLRAGVTGDAIDRVVFSACVERGAYPSPLNYHNFPKSLCVSVNEVICHGIPGRRVIKDGDVVNLDISVYKNGFHADLNETFLVGQCDEDAVRLVQTSYECLLKSTQLIQTGTLYRELGAVISKHAAQNRCAVVSKYCGHGIGRLFHCAPNVPHYAKNKAKGIMRPGHVFTVEPMINLGGNWGDLLWPDNWTAVTKDGNRSSQFEHTFLVTDAGFEILTARHGTDITAMPAWDQAVFQR